MRRQIRGALAVFTGALLLTMGVTATGGHSARADDNGVGLKPVLGWSSWSFVRRDPTARTIEAQAKALKDSGLAKNGFVYANVDDFWYQCPGSQGPDVDQYGRWVTDPVKFPPRGSRTASRSWPTMSTPWG